MAFNTNNGSGNNNAAEAKDEAWKAHGFLNVYVKNNAGGRTKLGSIPLKKANEREQKLSQWLAGDDDAGTRLNRLLSECVFEFNVADNGTASDFAFFADIPAEEKAA